MCGLFVGFGGAGGRDFFNAKTPKQFHVVKNKFLYRKNIFEFVE